MEQFLAYPLEEIPFVFLVLLIAFTVHEFAHAYTAYKFGDPTAKEFGRVTLNPMAHLDVLGTILILVAGFGWAKPVPVNRKYFKNPRLMGIIVTFAGPLSNLIIAFIGTGLFYAMMSMGAEEALSKGAFEALYIFFKHLIFLNILLFLFNLIPLPPLDGYRILEDLLPTRIMVRVRQYEQWAVFLFLLIVFIPPIARVTINPLLSLRDDIYLLMSGFYQLFF